MNVLVGWLPKSAFTHITPSRLQSVARVLNFFQPLATQQYKTQQLLALPTTALSYTYIHTANINASIMNNSSTYINHKRKASSSDLLSGEDEVTAKRQMTSAFHAKKLEDNSVNNSPALTPIDSQILTKHPRNKIIIDEVELLGLEFPKETTLSLVHRPCPHQEQVQGYEDGQEMELAIRTRDGPAIAGIEAVASQLIISPEDTRASITPVAPKLTGHFENHLLLMVNEVTNYLHLDDAIEFRRRPNSTIPDAWVFEGNDSAPPERIHNIHGTFYKRKYV